MSDEIYHPPIMPAGVIVTQEQYDLIKGLKERGELEQAHKLILDILALEFGEKSQNTLDS